MDWAPLDTNALAERYAMYLVLKSGRIAVKSPASSAGQSGENCGNGKA